jgi:hypothetical protein
VEKESFGVAVYNGVILISVVILLLMYIHMYTYTSTFMNLWLGLYVRSLFLFVLNYVLLCLLRY